MSYDIDNIRKDINNLVVVTNGRAEDRVVGISQDGLGNAVNSNFSSPLIGQLQQSLSQMRKQVATAFGQFSQRGFSQANIINARQTIQIWSDTNETAFSLSMLFISIRESEDVVAEILKLLRYVYPEWKDGNGIELFAPNGYAVKNAPGSRFGFSAKGLISVSLGQYFFATEQIMTDVTYAFSERILPNGKPLWATATIGFKPFRMIDYKDISNYFKPNLSNLVSSVPEATNGLNRSN